MCPNEGVPWLHESLPIRLMLQLELKIDFRHVDGPSKLVSLALVVDFVHSYPHVLTPAKVETHIMDMC